MWCHLQIESHLPMKPFLVKIKWVLVMEHSHFYNCRPRAATSLLNLWDKPFMLSMRSFGESGSNNRSFLWTWKLDHWGITLLRVGYGGNRPILLPLLVGQQRVLMVKFWQRTRLHFQALPGYISKHLTIPLQYSACRDALRHLISCCVASCAS